jgi:hypothetical protein
MSSESRGQTTATERGIGQRVAETIANTDTIPLAVRAVLGYYAESGTLSVTALRLRQRTDQFMTEAIRNLYEPIEAEIESQIDAAPQDVSFKYDTKLTLPAELTIGQVYYRAKQQTAKEFDPVRRTVRTPLLEYFRFPFDKEHETKRRNVFLNEYDDLLETIERAEGVTELVTAALIDGDMRDALNDEEYEDFQVDFPVESPELRRQIAVCAQETLQTLVEDRFEQFGSGVREAYEEAVELSEQHQERDQYFRKMAERARAGDEDAKERIETEFKYADFDTPPAVFDESDLKLPYLLTQYNRVGVIYRGMIQMYREAGIDIDEAFEKSIILSIIGAQVWLDDVDDYEADLRKNQLTPVTAEYLLHERDADAFESVTTISQLYLDAAKRYAAQSNSPLAGIGGDYIYRSGDPTVLPQ